MVRIDDISNFEGIDPDYISDVQTIIKACNHEGWSITPKEAYDAWNDYSDSMAAGWLGLPYPTEIEGEVFSQEQCDKEIFAIIERYATKQ